jgi:ferric-dicitrate binding protein FerR (iron transport regulator)
VAENNQHFNIQELADKWAQGKLTPDEQAYLERWYADFNDEHINLTDSRHDNIEELRNAMLGRINRQIQQDDKPVRILWNWPRIAAAASILVFLSVGGYLLSHRQQPQTIQKQDVAPYTAKAILKTGHGKIILLDPAKNGLLASQGNVSVTKTAEGQIAYTSSQDQTVTVYDTIQVPAGGRPQLVKLSDGSNILLNAATTLRFPESFSATKREKLELISGEIYAVVIHNKNAPLQIRAPGQVITDVGTEFDINAYPDEADTRTTLVEGAVEIDARSVEKVLAPGQQAILTGNGFTVDVANIEQVTAWTNGYFRFNGEHIDVIMRQLARWYNIKVSYEGKMTTEVFYGKVTRKRNISEVLKMLEKTQKIHFKVEGRRVTVLSK